MSILSGVELSFIRPPLFEPMTARTEHPSGLTFGTGPAGYDVRVAEDHVLAPGAFALSSVHEKIRMPDWLVAIVHDKSTWARRGLALQNTVVEPGWRGFLTLEMSNHGPETLVIVAGMPIAQLIFHVVLGEVRPYDGRYQDQESGPQPARMKEQNNANR